MTMKLRSACALLAFVGGCSSEEDIASTTNGLTFPAPGESRTIGFEFDAAEQPIPRGTYIAEQYAAAGIHFNGAFAVGRRQVDFTSFSVAPLSNAMICTWVAWQDTGVCFPPVGIIGAQMVVTFDFPACAVTIEGRTRGDGQQDGDILTMSAFDANNTLIQTISEYVNTGPNPPTESIVLGTVAGAGIRRVVIEDGELDALDNLLVERCTEVPPPPVCGDGNVDEGEQCDDGNTTNGDGCSSNCTVEPPPPPPGVCGDGNVDPGEQCDDGNTNYNDGCSGTCQIETLCCCGNGSVEPGEQCDDGNHDDGDGCSSTCQVEPDC